MFLNLIFLFSYFGLKSKDGCALLSGGDMTVLNDLEYEKLKEL